MLAPASAQLWVYTKPTDMRKQIDGLAAIAKQLKLEPASGDYFIFINRKRTMMKILYYHQGGYCLWLKRLERGCFAKLKTKQPHLAMTWAKLQCLIEGIKWQEKQQNRRLN